jgi:flagellar hook-length control protein FliK
MPQVNTIAINIAPSNDFSPIQSGVMGSSTNSNKDFSQVIEQHYKSQQTQQSGKKQETSGNKAKLDTEVQPEKDNAQRKLSSPEAKSIESDTGTSSGDEVNTDVQNQKESEKLLSSDKYSNDKIVQLEDSQKDIAEKKETVLININIESLPSNKLEDSTEQLMSLLSASDKILKDDVKSDSTVTPNNSKKLSRENVEHNFQEKTELDVLLKQVLGGNKEKKSEVTKEIPTQVKLDKSLTEQVKVDKSLTEQVKVDKSLTEQVKVDKSLTEQVKVDKNLTEQVKAPAKVDNEAVVTKDVSKVKPEIEGDKIIKVEGKLDLSVLSDKKIENDKASSMQSLAVNNQLPYLKNKENEITKASLKTEHVVDKTINTGTQQISAGDLEAIVADVENIITDAELEKNNTEFLGIQDKAQKPDKNTQNNTKNDSVVAKNITGPEFSSKVQNEKVVSEVAASIDTDHLNTDKVAFAGVSVSGEKQAMENSQNQSRVVNQATHKVLEPQNTDTGEQSNEQSKEQSLEQQNQKLAQSLSNAEKLVSNDVQIKEKPFSEIFDKKAVHTSIENTLNRDIHQVNEATKIADSAEKMITKLASDNVQSTAQSITNSKQVTSLQNEALSVYRKDFTGELKDKVMVMMNQKLQQIEIRLDPQELGNVNVKINLQNEQAVVNFTVQNQQAKEAFDQNLGRLKEMLAESGVDVGDANVEQQNKQNDDEALGDGRQSGEGDVTGNELSDLSDTQTLNLVKGSSTGVDYYA